MKRFLTEFALRWKMRGPDFFHDAKRFFLLIGVPCVSLLGGAGFVGLVSPNVTIQDIYPVIVIDVLQWGSALAALGYVMSRLPVDDPKKLKEELNKTTEDDGRIQ